MKRLTALFLTLAMTLSGTVCPSAAESVKFAAFANGEKTASVSVGDSVEITLSMEASNSYTFYSMQDYVKFDTDLLQLDPESITVKQVISAGEYVDLMNYSAIKSGSVYDRVFVNRASLTGVDFSASETVLTFTVTALKEGTAEITHYRPEMTDENNNRYSITEAGAAVVISSEKPTEESTEETTETTEITTQTTTETTTEAQTETTTEAASETTTTASRSSGGGGGSSSSYHTVKLSVNGEVTEVHVSSGGKLAEPEEPVVEGYTFEGWYTDMAYITPYDFTKAVTTGFTLYAYMKPVEDETAADERNSGETGETEETENTEGEQDEGEGETSYTDVSPEDWFSEAVEYMKEKGIMLGISDDEFAPYLPLTRGMFVTVLHRIEGTPEPTAKAPFGDVAEGLWYSEAVDWGYENNIIYGYSDSEYGVNDRITREQMAAIIYRYAEFKGIDVTIIDGEADFNDSEKVSNYAKPAVKWVQTCGFMTGDENKNFRPLDNATRAETAQVFMNVVENLRKLVQNE
ncbi:MAG: S-layer homology domain-containing protein [Eubacterium sp.]|nr:S-layer homology domain-containing protein [Eubacterium sp.]